MAKLNRPISLVKDVRPPEEQLKQAMADAGINPPEHVYIDGRVHRFTSEESVFGKRAKKPGWYIIFGEGIPAGRFGCWRLGIDVKFRAEIGRKLTIEEEMLISRRMSEAKTLRDEERKRQGESAAETVSMIWEKCTAASGDHPYLKQKGIDGHGARVTGDGRLIVPLYNPEGKLSSLQYISHNGEKMYHQGGITKGMFWQIGSVNEPGPIFIAEGFATASTIHQVSGRPCMVAYSASNLVPVTRSTKTIYGERQEVVIVADNDKSGVGLKYAEQASAKYGARIVQMPELGDANDYHQSGGDLGVLLSPSEEDWLIQADEFSAHPQPIDWLVEGWVQDKAMVMVHGQSGVGKTFVVLDWCLHIASNKCNWNDKQIANGTVVYLAGEGHYGLRSRIAAWKKHHGEQGLNMWVSRGGCDLNTQSGFLQAVNSIRKLSETPKIIVVDTLHRFLEGDENSAKDAKTMIDACAALISEFECTVLLVHHTGVSEESQHRARGSSAWRGALDIEVSVVEMKKANKLRIIQRKSKDSEQSKDIDLRLVEQNLDGWVDSCGREIGSAVVEYLGEVDGKENETANSYKHVVLIQRAWEFGNSLKYQGKPYVSHKSLSRFLIDSGVEDEEVKSIIKKKDGPIVSLVRDGILEPVLDGWMVVDKVVSSVILILG